MLDLQTFWLGVAPRPSLPSPFLPFPPYSRPLNFPPFTFHISPSLGSRNHLMQVEGPIKPTNLCLRIRPESTHCCTKMFNLMMCALSSNFAPNCQNSHARLRSYLLAIAFKLYSGLINHGPDQTLPSWIISWPDPIQPSPTEPRIDPNNVQLCIQPLLKNLTVSHICVPL